MWRRLVAVNLAALLSILPLRSASPAEFVLASDGTIVGSPFVVTIESEVTLYDVARHFDLGMPEVQSVNPGINPWMLRYDQRVLIPTQFNLPPKPWMGIIVNLAARRLYYFPSRSGSAPQNVLTFPIGIGDDDWETPVGSGTITAKIANPSWIPPASIREEHARRGDLLPEAVPPGPNNPMGLFKLQTSFPAIYLHGTNRPWSIGERASHGCIRLYPEDIAELFRRVPVGTPVNVIDAPYVFGTSHGVLYLSAYVRPSRPAQQAAITAFADIDDELRRTIDWTRFDRAVNSASSLPQALSRSAAEQDPRSGPPPLPYRFPAYGIDANNAGAPH